ncbi:unnamed protein product [Diatraea saccharalis]|uniref:Inter-alpha-trypsin inhibitor heavy chain H4-like n=1 Tax=Diatraea saccharalis TaxID=40085 RepID=A0A9N9QLH6_9NEOP|nr:unnamed protein product [Diatraea saccharalis]
MRPQWQPVLGCICILASSVCSMVVPTQDTMVVARSDDGATVTSALPTEVTTEEPVPPIKLTDMDVTSNIALRYANTAVVTSVRNPAKRAQEATFRVLLPETAFISGFTMTIDGKAYKAYVKEKEEAKQIYNQAVSQGLSAGHVTAKARDSNQFTVSVNVEPNTVIIFNLTYEELLVRRNGVYNHAINLHPGALVPKLTVTVNIKEGQKITTLRVPEVRTGNEIDATEQDAQNTKAVIEKTNNDREAKVVFKPDLEEQKRLIEIYREKSKETRANSHSYSFGYNPSEDDDNKDTDGVLGQFVVQYDVERPKNGEILVNDGYFVHFYAPSDLPPLNKHVVFVLDTSGSMMDRKIVQLREAMQTILSELNQGDYFSIVEFASTVKVYEMKEADKEPVQQNDYFYYNFDYNAKPKLFPPSQATPENIAKAKVIVSRLTANGGTNIYSALDVAIDLIKKGVGWTPSETPKANETTTEVVQEQTTAASTPTVSSTTEIGEESEKLEPIIIFLTDGDPTVGVTDPTRITNHLTEKNTGFNKATIFSLAFGEDADRKFLRKLSLKNDGFMRHIYEASDAALQLRDFYRQVASPLLADVKFIYPKKQVKENSVTKHQFRRYYGGSEVVVAGALEPTISELTPQVIAFCGVWNDSGRKQLEILPKAPVPAKKEKFLPLERLWAHLTVKQLLDERDAADSGDSEQSKEDSPEKKALAIALKYEFVTPLTSLVVVKPNATDHVDAESVDKQEFGAGFAGMPGLPGPSFAPSAAYARPGAPLPVFATSSFTYPGPPEKTVYSFVHKTSSSLMSADAVIQSDVLEDSFDYSDAMQTTSQIAAFPIITTPAPRPDVLMVYHLQDYSWIRPLLDAKDAVTLQVNSTTVTLQLTKDDVPKPADASDPDCAVATDGVPGVCVYLTRCTAAQTITAESYSNTYCVVNDKYAGVCCPKTSVDVGKTP